MPAKDLSKLIEKLNHEKKNAIKNGIYHLIQIEECLKNNIMPFIIENEHKAFYYRGIREYHNTKGYLKDTILQSQDNFNEMVSYFFSK